MAENSPKIHLLTYFRSSCSARLRIALHLKKLEFESAFVNLLKGEQHSEEHAKLNPSRSVPVLSGVNDSTEFSISQSVAALEYLEEAYPDCRPLLPPLGDPVARSKVRVLVNIIACDVQPVTNLRIILHVEELGGDRAAWSKKYISQGLSAYEHIVKDTAGEYSVGDDITLADVCLVPALWGAERFDMDLKAWPTVSRIYARLCNESAVRDAHWQNQPDTPASLK